MYDLPPVTTYPREHKFVMGRNNARSRRMAIMHEGRARRAGLEWEMVDIGVLYHAKNGMCGICRAPVAFESFTVDHIMPLSKGGAHKADNLQLAHASCNASKGNSY
jgi:5-methylcytosine-specific restriction endonuclease McrA